VYGLNYSGEDLSVSKGHDYPLTNPEIVVELIWHPVGEVVGHRNGQQNLGKEGFSGSIHVSQSSENLL